MYLKSLLLALLIAVSVQNGSSAESLIEFKTTEGSFTGTPIFHNKQICWLAAEDGSYSGVLFRDVISSRRLKSSFHPFSSNQMKTQLQKELGKSYEVITAGQFVVAAPQGKAREYTQILERMSRSFFQYTSVRKLPVKKLSFPLTTVIYPNHLEFSKAANERGIQADRTLKGFYHPWTNRILMFEEQSESREGSSRRTRSQDLEVSSETISTLIHEGVHQLAFNQGLHSRVGKTPRWVVEGLANMLEVNAELNRSRSNSVGNINPDRLLWFKRYVALNRKETIAEFIVDDEQYFRANALNANSQAWALTYFLAEEYSSAYAGYLKIVAERDPLQFEYPAEERLADFQNAFGNDLPWLEVRFLRYIDQLTVDP